MTLWDIINITALQRKLVGGAEAKHKTAEISLLWASEPLSPFNKCTPVSGPIIRVTPQLL